MHYPEPLKKLIAQLKKFPGVGSRTAERYAFDLLSWSENDLTDFALSLSTLNQAVVSCEVCHALKDEGAKCHFCESSERDASVICVVATAKDIYPIEETRSFKGMYHVLGGLLSPISGKTPDTLNIDSLKKRVVDSQVKEVIIAIDSTLEGDTTSLFLKQELEKWQIPTSRLAFGLPMGSSLDYVDGGTLMRALEGRKALF